MIVSGTGIILSRSKFLETSALISLISPEVGLVSSLAKGAFRKGSPSSELGLLVKFNIYKRKESGLGSVALDVVTSPYINPIKLNAICEVGLFFAKYCAPEDYYKSFITIKDAIYGDIGVADLEKEMLGMMGVEDAGDTFSQIELIAKENNVDTRKAFFFRYQL